MKQYICDQCRCLIDGHRYSVRIELQSIPEPAPITETDLDQDSLDQIADEIAMMDSTADFHLPENRTKKMALDLCPACARKYEKDPLGRESRNRFPISPN